MKAHELCTATRDTVRFVPMEEWGRDHWSTLLYLESRWVDHGGHVRNEQMSCNARRHRKLFASDGNLELSATARAWKDAYSTRLRDGQEIGHDDWDSLEDMAAEGLLTFDFVDRGRGPFEGGAVVVQLTERGAEIAGQLRAHRGSGRPVSDFMPKATA